MGDSADVGDRSGDRDRSSDARDRGLPALAPVYCEALRMEAAGHDYAAIGRALDVRVEAVPALLQLARRKRARLAERPDDT